MSKPIIEANHVSKKYKLGESQPYYTLRDSIAEMARNPFQAVKDKLHKNEFWALNNVSFTVNSGEAVGIIGRNGAGKSTLLKVLSRITPPTKGEVLIRGRVGSLLEVGTGFHPELTGRENIYLNGAILGMKQSEVKRKFDEIVAFAEVEKFLDTPLKRYSSGMYMRLAFAVASHLETEILIVDEVLAVGDAEFQKKSLNKMGEVTHQGRTVLFVSHNLLTVQNLCSKSILLDGGKIKAAGNTSEVIEHYTNNKSSTSKATLSKLDHVAGPGDIKFTGIKISNASDDAVIGSDDTLKFILTYGSEFKKPIAGARIVITVVSEASQQTVLRLDSDVTAKTLAGKISPQGVIVCETGVINLVEGKYYANIDFLIQGTSCSYITRAGEFSVETNISSYKFKAYPDKSVCDYVIAYSFKQK